jgi:hypothetical protein
MEFAGAIREAKKGIAELVVLAFLEDEPRHGYELTQLIEARSGGALTFNFASLYATLYKLEERCRQSRQPLFCARWRGTQGTGPRRVG